MGEKDKLKQQLVEKMTGEQDKYRDWLIVQPPEEIINHAYEYTVREDIVMAMESLDLKSDQIQVLLMSKAPLDDIYKDFMKIEGDHMEIVSSCIEARATTLIDENYRDESALKTPLGYVEAHRTDKGISFSAFDVNLKEIESGIIEDSRMSAYDAAGKVWHDIGMSNVMLEDRDELLKRVQETRTTGKLEKEVEEEKPSFPPVYLQSAEYARDHDELESYRQSHRLNVECKNAIEEAISRHYSNNRLDGTCVKVVVDLFGNDRVATVLSCTIRDKDWDERIDTINKTWAKNIPVPVDPDARGGRNLSYVCGRSHPGLINLFVNRFRKEQEISAEKKPSVIQKLNDAKSDVPKKTKAKALENDRDV